MLVVKSAGFKDEFCVEDNRVDAAELLEDHETERDEQRAIHDLGAEVTKSESTLR